MPSLKTTTPLLGGKYYHIYNRGVNHQRIFFKETNYRLFLFLLAKYLEPYSQILAYCLLPNHFHLVIYIDDEMDNGESNFVYGNQKVNNISDQFRKMMISYSTIVNKQEGRSGSLFGSRFKRIELEDDDYLMYLIFYCHFNPERHQYCTNYKRYKYSSYRAVLSELPSKVSKAFVIELYGGKREFENYHNISHLERKRVLLED